MITKNLLNFLAGCLEPKCGQMKHEIIFFLPNCSLRGSNGFSVQGLPHGAACLEQGPPGNAGSFSRPKEQVRCFPDASQERSD